MAKMVKMKAKAFGTTAGVDGAILHFNPDSSDERYHSPMVDERDVPNILQRGYAEVVEGKDGKTEEGKIYDTTNLAHVDAERLADTASIDAKEGQVSSGLDSRQTVHWPADQNVRGDAEGVTDGPTLAGPVEVVPTGTGISEDDPDAPPPAKSAPAPKKK